MEQRYELANEIMRFLKAHAKTAATYDPEFDEPGDRFNGPDSAMMFMAAEGLKSAMEFSQPNSDFKSGCYAPMTDSQAKAWHDQLIAKINNYIVQHSQSRKP